MEIGALPTGEAKRAAVRDMFDRIAPRYDALNRLFSLGLDRRWRRLALTEVRVSASDRVIDVACGTGDFADLAAARGASVVGVDFAREMLRKARSRPIEATWVRGDAEALPFAKGAASVVVCGFSLRNFANLGATLREMARVLAPGGRMALVEVDRPSSPWLRRAHSLYFDHLVPRVGGWLSDRAAYSYLPRSTAYLPPPAELRELIEGCGFEQTRHRSLMLGAAQILTAVRTPGAAR